MINIPFGHPFWIKLGRFIVGLVQRRFNRGGDEDNRWAPPKLREGRPLMATGELMESINHLEVPTVAGTVVRVGTAKKYAAIQQFGGTIVVKRAKALFIPLTKLGRKIGPQPKEDRVKLRVLKNGKEVYEPVLKYGVDFVLKGAVNIPARPFLRFTPADVGEIKAFVAYELPRAV